MSVNYRTVCRVVNNLSAYSWETIVAHFGDLNVGVGDSRNAGNCDEGTDRFADRIRDEWQRKYGEVCYRKYAPIRTVVDLYLEAREECRIRDRSVFLRWAIAYAIVRAGREAETYRMGR